ncbi:MAG: putative glycosyl transferase [Deltaproteobacteria bacterium]|nr:putative glycosyl transferase [Deltaproteobacteria bacterium]
MTPPTPGLSIVIVNYNGGRLVEACLASIAEHVSRRPFETIVVDNGSTDGSGDQIANGFPGVQLLRSPNNVGLCRAFNQGLARTSGTAVLALDNDTRLLPGALDAMLDFLDAHPEAGAVGSALLNPDGSLQAASRRFPSAWSGLFGRRSLLTRWFPNNPIARRDLMHHAVDQMRPFEVDWHSAASLMVRREVIDRIGGFDERFFVYWSDADWCARIRRAGWKVYTVPDARIIHDESLAGRKGRPRAKMVIDFHRGAWLYYSTHQTSSPWSPRSLAAAAGLATRAAALIGSNWLRSKLAAPPGGAPS